MDRKVKNNSFGIIPSDPLLVHHVASHETFSLLQTDSNVYMLIYGPFSWELSSMGLKKHTSETLLEYHSQLSEGIWFMSIKLPWDDIRNNYRKQSVIDSWLFGKLFFSEMWWKEDRNYYFTMFLLRYNSWFFLRAMINASMKLN